MNVLAIDPGTNASAYVLFDGRQPVRFGIEENDRLRKMAAGFGNRDLPNPADYLAIEMVASYGMPVGSDVYETVFWSGRFVEAAGLPFTKVYRREVKMHLCGSMKAKDANIRQALLDLYRERFSLPTTKAVVGLKRSPGPLHGFKADLWAALGVAETWWATRRES